MGRYTGKKCRLLTMLSLTSAVFLVEIVIGYVTNSMALIADSFHMLSDVAALFVAFLSVKMSPKKWSKNTFGWARAEVLGALVNAVFLVALCFSITVEAIKRFIEVEIIHEPKLLIIVGTVGLVVNIVGVLLFLDYGGHGHSHGLGGHGHSHSLSPKKEEVQPELANDSSESDTMYPRTSISFANHNHSHNTRGASELNMRGVFLHVLSDALGSVIVICSALVVTLTEWEYKYYIDPALSLILVLLILHSVWPVLRESALILLQTVPTHIQVDAIKKRLLENVDGVIAVHEFHVWQLAGDRIIASAHIRCRNLSEYMKIAEKVKEFFHNEGIHSTTIQPEFVERPSDEGPHDSNRSSEQPCALHCPTTDKDCVKATCCGSDKPSQNTPTVSPSASPFLCRQRNISSPSQQADALESGTRLLAHNDAQPDDKHKRESCV